MRQLVLVSSVLLASPLAAQVSVPGLESSAGLEVRTDPWGHRARAYRDLGPATRPHQVATALVTGWEAFGPYGGDAEEVGASPTTPGRVFAGLVSADLQNGGLMRSDDDGATWVEEPALSGIPVHDLEFGPGGQLVLGSLQSVWTSTDDGLSFLQRDLGVGATDQVFEITLDPSDAQRIWAGVTGDRGLQPRNVLLSIDGGLSWSDRTPAAAAGTDCTGIALDPNDSNRVFACFAEPFLGQGSVWFSSDAGQNWTDISAGLPPGPFTDLEHDGARVLVSGGELFDQHDVGLFHSFDEGQSWVQLSDGSWPSLAITDIELSSADPNLLLVASMGAGIFRSDDAGSSWVFELSGTRDLHLADVSVDPNNSLGVWTAGAVVAVAKSLDGGQSFQESNEGIRALSTVAILTHGVPAGELTAAVSSLNTGALYNSTDGGANWVKLTEVPATRWNEIEYSQPGILFALSNGPVSIAPEGVYARSPAQGWVHLGPDAGPLYESDHRVLDINKTTNVMLLGGRDTETAGNEGTIWRSDDMGQTWTKTYESDPGEVIECIWWLGHAAGDDLALIAYSDAGVNQTGGILRTLDAGLSFVPATQGLPASAQCRDITYMHGIGGIWCTANDDPTPGLGGVYITTDFGASWTQAAGTQLPIARVTTDALRPGELYAGRSAGSPLVQKTTDFGANFENYEGALDTGLRLRDQVFWEGVNSHLEQCDYLMLATDRGLWQRNIHCALEADVESVSLSTGGVQTLQFSLGPKHDFQTYLLLGSASGTGPGVSIDGWKLPLNPDPYFDWVATQANQLPFTNTFGVFDETGMTTASITVPPGLPPTLAGVTVHHAYIAVAPGMQGIPFVDLASNACVLRFLP